MYFRGSLEGEHEEDLDNDEDDDDISLEAPFPANFEFSLERHPRLSLSDSETETEDNLVGASDGTPFDPSFWERRFEEDDDENVAQQLLPENVEQPDLRPSEAPSPSTAPPPPPPPPLGAVQRPTRLGKHEGSSQDLRP